MKKFSMILSVLLALVVVFASCTKDDDNTSQNQIVGKWKVTAVNETENGKPVATTADIQRYVLEFNSNLSYTVTYQNVLVETGTYIINGGTISLKVNGVDVDYGSVISDDETNYSSGTFTIFDDNTLHIYFQFSEYSVIYIREIVASRIN